MNRREFVRSLSSASLYGGFAAFAPMSGALAQGKAETLLFTSEDAPNNLDVQGVGANRAGYEVSWNCYDRLISYGTKVLPDGSRSYDQKTLVPELATRWEVDAKGATFHLRTDAKFHDGTPVTAADVKWSLDRAVTIGGFPTSQMAAGSMLKADQFTVLDDHTIHVAFLRPDALTLPDIAVVIPCIYNSALVKKHATASDPWGLDYTKLNTAGGGAYKVVTFSPGSEVVFERNDAWTCGPVPALKRVVWRTVPSSGTRRALVERGDVDMSFDVPARDFADMKAQGKVATVSTPISNGMWSIELNVTKPPFDKREVRQAVAYAMPYQKIMDVVMYGQAKPLFGAASNDTDDKSWPKATAYTTDLAKAKSLLAEAGYPNGLETVISFDISQGVIGEPIAVLVQESLAAIGIKTTIDKVPGANWRGEMAKKSMPFMVNFFSGWLDYPEYFFFFCYHGQNSVFNTMSYKNPALDTEIDAARASAASGDTATYDKAVRKMIAIAYDDAPRIPLFQPNLNVVMKKQVAGYVYWFHRELDYRTVTKSA
jgi:peptide/nickel transport system substrate-binding protein